MRFGLTRWVVPDEMFQRINRGISEHNRLWLA